MSKWPTPNRLSPLRALSDFKYNVYHDHTYHTSHFLYSSQKKKEQQQQTGLRIFAENLAILLVASLSSWVEQRYSPAKAEVSRVDWGKHVVGAVHVNNLTSPHPVVIETKSILDRDGSVVDVFTSHATKSRTTGTRTIHTRSQVRAVSRCTAICQGRAFDRSIKSCENTDERYW